MTPSFRAGILAGFIAGAALSGFAFLLLKPRPAPEPVRPAPLPVARAADEKLAEENRRLKDEVAELSRPLAEPADLPKDFGTRQSDPSSEVREAALRGDVSYLAADELDRAQELHLCVEHIICDMIDRTL